MTQHGSFPGRPRGRRARQDNDVPEWQGYDATPQDEREFPDLAPIRPREARARDGRAQGDWQGQQGQPGQQGGYGYPDPSAGGGYPQGGQQAPGGGYPQGGQQAPGGGYGGYGGGQYGNGYQGGQGQASQQPWPGQSPAQPEPWQGQAPWPGQQAPSGPQQQAPSGPQQQAPMQPRPMQAAPMQQAAQQQPAKQKDPQDEDVPSWAEPDSVEAFSERWHRRGLDSRDERRGVRRKRRRLLFAGGGVLAVVIAVTVYLLMGGPGAANIGFGFVTQFQQGELQQVPNPCTAVPAATLGKYLPGKLKQAAPPLNSGASTECTWTLDAAPTYRVLQVQLVAYSPSGLASGDGSATFAAEDAFESFQNSFTSPGAKSGQPKAAVKDLSGMPGGNDTSAFQATQVFNRGGAIMDVTNVLVRYRNVIITVTVDGLEQSSKGKKSYGPVSMSDLTAAATTVGNEMAAKIVG